MLLRRLSSRAKNGFSENPPSSPSNANGSSSTLSPSRQLSSPSTAPTLPSMSVDYETIDAEDPAPNLGWLSSMALLGISKKDKTERYRALAKFRKVTSDHGVEDVAISDFLRALGVYAAVIDRSAKHTLKSKARAAKEGEPSTPVRKRPRPQLIEFDDVLSMECLPTPIRRSFELHKTEKSVRRRERRWSDLEDTQRSFQWDETGIPRPEVLPKGSESLSNSTPSDSLELNPSSPRNPRPVRVSSARNIPIPENAADVRAEHVQLLYHMLRHAESIYGFPINMASAPGTTLTRVTDRGIICSRTGLASADLKRASFEADAFLPAHYVGVDRQIKAVVVCVRGTANLVDSLTEIAATEDPLNMSGDDGRNDVLKGFGHSGVLRSARKLFTKIRSDILAALEENPDFELLITGHSLGAATASVLALIMRDDPEFPRALAFCFAPMPCMSYELAERTAEFAVTLVNGPDIVPRLSVSQLLPYFATARYVADLSKSRKVLLSLGLHQAVIDWQDLNTHNEEFISKLKNAQENAQLYIPGKVFQLIRKNEVHRRDAVRNKLFGKRQVEILAVPRTQFMEVRSRERGMFISHAPVTYRNGLINVLKSMDTAPLKTMSAGSVLRNLLATPISTNVQKNTDSESLSNLLDRLTTDTDPSLS